MAFFTLFTSLLALSFPCIAWGATVSGTIAIFAKDEYAASTAYAGLQSYGIPYQVVLVPQSGITLPALSSSATSGNYGAIVVVAEVSYDFGGSFRSALTPEQWQQLYDYQTAFGVRMVRLDVYPNADSGTTALGGTAEDQAVSFTNTSGFPTAGLKIGAKMSTSGIYHFPAAISDPSIAWELARFDAGGGYPASTAAVINRIGGRQQQVWFMPFAPEWSRTSRFLQHAWIHWVTRGLYAGFRRIYFSTQVDDMCAETDLYQPAGGIFRVRTGDLNAHKTWMTNINSRMPAGSSYIVEVGHNGNGNIKASTDIDNSRRCVPEDPVYYDQLQTPLEFVKPLGTGTNVWPPTYNNYSWSLTCARLDTLEQWWTTPGNRDAYAHVSHTFAHLALNNATYADAFKDIQFNQKWLQQIGVTSAARYSGSGLIPPAITGLKNGDAIRAWTELGIKYVVGDNTRPTLMNQQNPYWPLITTVANNGYAGLVIVPRWATNIYFNCDLPACDLAEWQAISAGSGRIEDLLSDAVATNTRHLLGLRWDPFMFHQANMRQTDAPNTVVNGVSQKLSLLQMWVEVVAMEMTRLTTWPIVTLKHDDIAVAFTSRMTRDGCQPKLTWNTSSDGRTITSVTVTTNGNTCGTKVPVTLPAPVASTNGQTTEQRGADPLTIWVAMNGSPRTFTFRTPIAV